MHRIEAKTELWNEMTLGRIKEHSLAVSWSVSKGFKKVEKKNKLVTPPHLIFPRQVKALRKFFTLKGQTPYIPIPLPSQMNQPVFVITKVFSAKLLCPTWRPLALNDY